MSGSIPSNSGQGFYRPGGIDLEYDKIQNQAPLPGVQPPTGAAEEAAAAVVIQSGYYDENAVDILGLIQGGTFNPPFTVTLMRREGMQVFKSDAGTKREANFVLCKETVRDPSDMLRITAGIVSEVYKPLNNMSLDFQLLLYLATQHGALKLPPQPPQPSQKVVEVEVGREATVEP